MTAVMAAGILIWGGCGQQSGQPAGQDSLAGSGQPAGSSSGAGGSGEESGGSAENAPAPGNWDVKTLLEADFLLYNVNCGTASPEEQAEGEIRGLCQSLADMAYGEDPSTKRKWGYIGADYLQSEEDSTGEGNTAAKWVIAKEADSAQADIRYDFEVPEGSYQVTVGFYNPFGVRPVDVECEGEQVAADQKLLRYQLKEVEFETKVTDGILSLRVYNDAATNFMDTPIASYIKVAAVPEYSGELLQTAMDAMPAEGAEEIYTQDTAEAFKKAYEEAELLAKAETADSAEYREKFINLRSAYKMLVEKYRYNSFKPGEQWKDTENNLIQAHGGQVQQMPVKDEDTGETVMKWVWVGEDKTAGTRGGIRAYSSDDLYNWKYEGIIMRNVSSREALDTDEYFKAVYGDYTPEQLDNVYMCINDSRAIIERPKLIYNEKTGKYVLWFHADGPTATSDSSYAAACAGVAVSDSPFGPYRFIDRYRLNVCPDDQEDKYPESRGMARDMNLFQDEDGTAYIIYSSEENLTLYISRLNDEYTYLETEPDKAVYGEDFIRLFPGAQREAPALFLKDGKYYLMTSGCTGWAPNQARYYVADSVLGEWVSMGDPCVGDDNHTTFESQSTCIFREPESGEWIYMGDRWFADELSDSRYIWLPISFKEDGAMEISFVREWKYGES